MRTPPFSLAGNPSPVAAFDGAVSNPGLAAQPGSGVVDFSSGGYPGFSDVVDLRSRGRLSDDLAFRVRAQQAALWRAEVFDRYDASRWTITDDETEPLPSEGDGLSVVVPSDVALRNTALGGGSSRVVQTFYIEAAQPNVLFAAASARQVYFPAAGLRGRRRGVDPLADPARRGARLLRRLGGAGHRRLAVAWRPAPVRPADMGPYLQLPASLPARVGELAARITRGRATQYDQVVAVQSWLRANTEYDLERRRATPMASMRSTTSCSRRGAGTASRSRRRWP